MGDPPHAPYIISPPPIPKPYDPQYPLVGALPDGNFLLEDKIYTLAELLTALQVQPRYEDVTGMNVDVDYDAPASGIIALRDSLKEKEINIVQMSIFRRRDSN